MDRRELLVMALAVPMIASVKLENHWYRGPRDTDGPEWDRWLEEYEKHQCGVLSQD